MRKENWTFQEAIEFVRSRGRKVMPTLGFERQLKAYEGFLRQSSPSGGGRRSPVRWRSSRMRFPQAQLPSLATLPLHSSALSPAPPSSVFATLLSRREAATHQLRSRPRLLSSDCSALLPRKGQRTLLAQSQSSESNNFEVRRALLSQRASKPRSRPKPVLP